jgi:hypothetical protein
MEIKSVLQRKDGVKMVIIPKHSSIKKGDKVLITNNLTLINKFLMEEKNARRKE